MVMRSAEKDAEKDGGGTPFTHPDHDQSAI
jgi:hypothetical protein